MTTAQRSERDFHSHSSLDTYMSCPMKYKLRYIDRVEQIPMMAGVGGSAIHRATEIIDRNELWK